MAGQEQFDIAIGRATANAYRPLEDLHGEPGCVAMEEDTFFDITSAYWESKISGPLIRCNLG